MSHAVFEHLTGDLLRETFKDNSAKRVTKQAYEVFLKEVVFEKLKGKRFGQAFTERFNIHDRVLSNYSIDKNAIDHIRFCKYVEQ